MVKATRKQVESSSSNNTLTIILVFVGIAFFALWICLIIIKYSRRKKRQLEQEQQAQAILNESGDDQEADINALKYKVERYYPSISYLQSRAVYVLLRKYRTPPDQCIICLERFLLNQQVRMMSCLHFFHTTCIDMWFKKNSTCPHCNKDFNIKRNLMFSANEFIRIDDYDKNKLEEVQPRLNASFGGWMLRKANPLRRHSCPAFQKHRHQRFSQDQQQQHLEQNKEIFNKDETLLTADIQQLMKSQHFSRRLSVASSIQNSELNFGRGPSKKKLNNRQLSELQTSNVFLKSQSKMSGTNLPLFSPSKIRLSKNYGSTNPKRKMKSLQNRIEDEDQKSQYQTHHGGFLSQIGAQNITPLFTTQKQRGLNRMSNENSMIFQNVRKSTDNQSGLQRADSKYSLYPEPMQNLIQTMRRPSTSNQQSYIFGNSYSKRHNQMKSLMNMSEMLANINTQNQTLKGNPSLEKLNHTNVNFQDNYGLITGGRQGKLIDMKYSRDMMQSSNIQLNNRHVLSDPRLTQKGRKYKNQIFKFNRSEIRNPDNDLIKNQYGQQIQNRDFMNSQGLNSLTSYQAENFERKINPKVNKTSVFPQQHLRLTQDKKVVKNKKKVHSEKNIKKIKREKKFSEQEKKGTNKYEDQGTEESNIQTTFENYMNEIEGMNNEEPPSFIDMNDARVRTSKTPFLQMSSIDQFIPSKNQLHKKSKDSQQKTNKNNSQFSDLIENHQNNLRNNSIMNKSLIKASKRYIDDTQDKQQNQSGLRIANQTLYLTNNTQNNEIFSETEETKKNMRTHQFDTLDEYEKTLQQVLNNKQTPVKNTLPPMRNLKLATIETDTSKNYYHKRTTDNAGNITAISPRDNSQNQNTTRNRIFAKEDLLLSPLNNQYMQQFERGLRAQQQQQQEQLQLTGRNISKIEQVLQTARSSKEQLIIKKKVRKDSRGAQNKLLSNPIIKLQRKLSEAVTMNHQAIAKNLSSPTSSTGNIQ